MDAALRLETALEKAWPHERWRDVPVVLAVSGGADSVALLRAVARRPGGPRIVAHFDHGLRETSGRDARFVAELAERMGLPVRLGRPPRPLASDDEAGARQARYAFLTEVARGETARYVATAHNRDDQTETVLHRILRGSGLAGLKGIPRSREFLPGVALVRPLLDLGRREVIEYLAQLDQPYCTDPSNASSRYTRNRIRRELIPLLEHQYNPNVREALLRLAELAGESREVIDEQVEALVEKTVRRSGASVELDCLRLASRRPLLVRELLIAVWKRADWPLREMTHEKWTQLAGLVSEDSPITCDLPGSVRAVRAGAVLTLSRTAD